MGGTQSATAVAGKKKDMKERPSQAPGLGARATVNLQNIPDIVATTANKKYAEEMLAIHNDYRAQHKVSPLKLNKKLNELAQDWASRMSLIASTESRPDNKFGENLYWSRWATDPHSVCNSWYKEGKKWKYGKEPNPPPVTNVLNFTQMVWKSTTEMGVGIATSWSNMTIVVVNYKAKGNIKGEFVKNVLEPSSQTIKKSKEEEKADKKDAADLKGALSEKLQDKSAFVKMMLQFINEFREVHSAKRLKNVSSLNESAQVCAENAARVQKLEPCKLPYGVSASYYCSKWTYDAKDACQFWYNQNKRFKFGVEPAIVPVSTADFTQMVWCSTTEVGFGRASALNGYVYIVAFYRPAGNIPGEFCKNVKLYHFADSPTQDTIERKRSRAITISA